MLRSLAVAAALGLALIGCSKDASPEPKPIPATAKAAPPEPAAPPRAFDPPTKYTVGVDDLLALLPAQTSAWAVVRDPAGLLALAAPWITHGLEPTASLMKDGSDAAHLRRTAETFAAFRKSLAESDVDLDRGLVLFEHEGALAYVYAGKSATDLDAAWKALNLQGVAAPSCAAVEDHAARFVCAHGPKAPTGYAPGKASARYRTEAEPAAMQLDDANVIGHLDGDDQPFAIATPPGLLYLAAGPARFETGMPQLALAKGSAEALRVAAPGGAFAWARTTKQEITRQSALAPQIARDVVEAFDGELFVGAVSEPPALAILLGVSDPAPATGLVALAPLQFSGPTTLPEGTRLTVRPYNVGDEGDYIQTIRAELQPSDALQRLLSTYGAQPEAWAFAAGHYFAAVLGADELAVMRIADDEGGEPTTEVLDALPLPMATALEAGDVGMAIHVPLDVLAAESGRALLGNVAALVPGEDVESDEAQARQEALRRALRPVSSVSAWLQVTKGPPTVHVAIEILGDDRSEDGRDAAVVLADLAAGRAATPLYDGLAAAHGKSPRGVHYRTRAEYEATINLGSAVLVAGFASAVVPQLAARFWNALPRAKTEATPPEPTPPG